MGGGGTTDGGYPLPRSRQGGTPFQVQVGWRGTPSQVWMGGVPHPADGYPLPAWEGGNPPPGKGVPPPGKGVPPPPPAQCVLAMRRAVCLLRSRRRTFLFGISYHSVYCCKIPTQVFYWVFGQWVNSPLASTCLLTRSLIWTTGQYTSGSRGPLGPWGPWPPDLEAQLYSLEVPVYNLRTKNQF